MKKLIIYALFILSGLPLAAQLNLGHEVIASAGGEMNNGGVYFSTTIGESLIETVASGSLVMTQGFQQGPNALASSLDDLQHWIGDYRVFPLPATDHLTIELDMNQALELELSLVDMAGRVLPGKSLRLAPGTTRGQILTVDLAQGNYLLLFRKASGEVLHTVKIPKQ